LACAVCSVCLNHPLGVAVCAGSHPQYTVTLASEVDCGMLVSSRKRSAVIWPNVGERAVASFCAAVLTGICLGNVCSCHEMLRAQRPGSDPADFSRQHPKTNHAAVRGRAKLPGY
jgi:hypothetical protein